MNPSANTGPPEPAVVSIGGRRVGGGCRTYIVAEAGVNHDGSVEKALGMADVAAAAGADAVKFQMFRAAELATATAGTAGYQKAAGCGSQRQMLEKLELSAADFGRVRDHCRRRPIDFLATPFSPPDVDRLVALDPPAIKIASTDLNNVPLLLKAAQTGLPLIVSTGASTADEIRAAVRLLQMQGTERRLVLLHCVSCYPTPVEAANLRVIGTLRAAFGIPCGFSDHTLSVRAGAWAAAAGACLLEKHFTLDRSAAGPDHAMSLEPGDLREYVNGVREVESALGSGQMGMREIEADVRAVARKSVVTARDLPAGAVLTPELLALKRPGGGIRPDELGAVVGRRLLRPAAADTVLTWEMIG